MPFSCELGTTQMVHAERDVPALGHCVARGVVSTMHKTRRGLTAWVVPFSLPTSHPGRHRDGGRSAERAVTLLLLHRKVVGRHPVLGQAGAINEPCNPCATFHFGTVLAPPRMVRLLSLLT